MSVQESEIVYHLRRAALGQHPGRHRARVAGTGLEAHAVVPIDRVRGRPRFDIAASLRDPERRLLARMPRQLASIDVQLALDCSASMLAADESARRALLVRFAAVLARSAQRTGDAFGLIPFAARVLTARVLPPSRSQGIAHAVGQSLQALPFTGTSARGVREIAAHVRRGRSIVFLVSDFLMPLEDLHSGIDALADHALVPVVAWTSEDAARQIPDGLTRVVDRETGRRRWVWMRPRIRAALRDRYQAHAAAVTSMFARAGARPFFLGDTLDVDALNAHLAI